MRKLKLIGWFILDNWMPILGFLIGTALFFYLISPAVEALVQATVAAFD